MKQYLRLFFAVLAIAFAWVAPVEAQVAQGGNYTLDQSVIATGGGQNSSGGGFTIDGTIGQAAAGANSTNSPYSVKSGFWTPPTLATTAASVMISGRVQTPEGKGLRNAQVTMTDMSGNARTILSGKSGYYQFADVTAGETYIFSVASKHYILAAQIITATEDLTDLNFVATPQSK